MGLDKKHPRPLQNVNHAKSNMHGGTLDWRTLSVKKARAQRDLCLLDRHTLQDQRSAKRGLTKNQYDTPHYSFTIFNIFFHMKCVSNIYEFIILESGNQYLFISDNDTLILVSQ